MSESEDTDILLFMNIFNKVHKNIDVLISENPTIQRIYSKNANNFINKILYNNPDLSEKDGYVYGLTMSLFLLDKITN